jgi:hypoxanthine phosphoribosyltransferase
MIGGIVPTGLLLPRLNFPLQVDYLHVTRYRGRTAGGDLRWIKHPDIPLNGRTILVIDDVLDEGVTLGAIVQACKARGASEVLTAVLVEKRIERCEGLHKADFTGLSADNRYLFGYGMDYKLYLRNAEGIFAVRP